MGPRSVLRIGLAKSRLLEFAEPKQNKQNTHVDASVETPWDAGSIPAASTFSYVAALFTSCVLR